MESRMEKALEKHLEETCRVPGVTGAICVDQHGLTMGVRGGVSKMASGPVASLAQQASNLHPQSYPSPPIVVVESQNGKILIKQEEDFVTGIFKA